MPSSINGELSVRCAVDTGDLPWTASPSGSVKRKRVHLVGEPESGQVTSVVRFAKDASFPAHDHPEGEEILVLDGVFSDEHGDWPAGSYLLNPEGFRHAPFSRGGCRLFVKLRQFPGATRRHVAVDHTCLPWEADETGVERKCLYRQEGFCDTTWIERWAPRTTLEVTHEGGVELFVLEGSFEDEAGSYGVGCWLRLPAGARHRPATTEGCTLYVKRGGLAYLISS